MRRSGKFYIKNEKQLMRELGLNPTMASGAGWLEKEDGQNDFIICQLKSTDSNNYRFSLKDFRVLENNANVVHKTPMFLIQFLKTNECFVLAKLDDLDNIVTYIKTGKCENIKCFIPDCKPISKKKIKSSENKRSEFWDKKREDWEKWQKK